MDINVLLTALVNVFREARTGGLRVDRIGLAPAYGGLVKDAYILGVSAPSMVDDCDCSEKTDIIIDLLFDKLSAKDRVVIDRVRVYDSVDELERHARSNYDEGFYNYCESPLEIRGITKEIV